MFNNSLKKQALRIHEETLNRYDESYKKMSQMCELLYNERQNVISMIRNIEEVINSIANSPKEFETKMGEVKKELEAFCETERYAKEAYEASLKAGKNIAGATAAGFGIATMAPSAMMGIATTFGTATTGTAISALSGAAAQKAAVAWIGRTFAGFAVKEGAGMAVGNAFLALAGPIGWGITAASTGISLVSLTNKNKELAEQAVEEAKDIARAREAMDETVEKISALKSKTIVLLKDLTGQKKRIFSLKGENYVSLPDEEKLFLGTVVNNTYSLSALLNENIE